MEPAVDVANFFRVEFHTDRIIRIAESSAIFDFILKWIHWYSFIRSTVALVIVLYEDNCPAHFRNSNTSSFFFSSSL